MAEREKVKFFIDNKAQKNPKYTYYAPAGPAYTWTINREHSIEFAKTQEKIIQELDKYTKEASDKPLLE